MKTCVWYLFTLTSLALGNNLLAQGTAFTYQGRLNDGTNPANGSYDLRFIVYDNSFGGSQQGPVLTNSATTVSNGLFTVTLDFGANFPGAARWLEIGVRTNGNGAFTTLTSRQPLTPSPYAITAENVVAGAGLSGTYGGAVTFNNSANSFNGAFSGNGANVTNVNAVALGGLSSSNFWQLGGNSVSAGQFIGSVNSQPLDLWVNGARAWRLDPGVTDASHSNAVNIVGGSSVNFVAPGVSGATISGGGAVIYNGAPGTNSVASDLGVIGGGLNNSIQSFANVSVVAGGFRNSIQSGANSSAIGGGFGNTIQSNAFDSVIGGGGGNFVGAINSSYCTIGGGNNNVASNSYATVVGGHGNTASGNYSVAGGDQNTASGQNSVAFGESSRALGDYSTAMGFSSLANGTNSTAMGNSAADADYSTAMGKSIANGHYSTAMGQSSTSEDFSTAMGDSSADGIYSTAMGVSSAQGAFSTAMGNSTASGDYSFAGGQGYAAHRGAFVWGDDSQSGSFSSSANNQFLIRAQGGVGIGLNNPTAALHVASGGNFVTPQFQATQTNTSDSCRLRLNVSGHPFWEMDVTSDPTVPQLQFWISSASGPRMSVDNNGNVTAVGIVTAASFNTSSDRNLKENFSAISPRDVLDKVAGLPITRWHFKEDKATEHLGPMAQDFYAAFGVGPDDKHIATVDEGGVALAAIQGLNQKLETQVKQKDERIGELEKRLNDLEQLVQSIAAKK